MINTKSFATAGVVLALLAAVVPAAAGNRDKACTSVPRDQWLSLEILRLKVETVGFAVRNAELKKACAKFDVWAKTGDRMVLDVDPATGTIVDGR
jgi:hypothetical protein